MKTLTVSEVPMPRTLATLLACLIALLVCEAGATAGSAPACGSKNGTTIATKGSLRVYVKSVRLKNGVRSDQEYACSSRYGRSVALDLCAFGRECFEMPNKYIWRGRYLIYVTEDVGATDSNGDSVHLADLKTGRNNSNLKTPAPGFDAIPGCASSGCIAHVIKLVAARGRSYAVSFQISASPFAEKPLPHRYYAVETHCVEADMKTDRAVLVDESTKKGIAWSLKISGHTIHWTSAGGARRSAPLCPGR